MLIREKDKLEIISITKDIFADSIKLWAYGSRVNGKAHETSDLDLVIISKDNNILDIDDLSEFKERLQSSNIPILVQVVDWYRIPKSFHQNILDNYEVMV